MPREINTDGLLYQTLLLVNREIKNIKKLTRRGKLDHETAQDLARYLSILDSINKNKDKTDEKKKKALAKMSTDELIELYQKEKGTTP
jgi:transcription termination factor NusB